MVIVTMQRYLNRTEAGKILAENLKQYAKNPDILVLALPRGGVPVAFEIAKTLEAPLDVFIVRKLGVPGHKELAMGAIATGGIKVFNEDIVKELHIAKEEIEQVIAIEEQELKRRQEAYRGNFPFPNLKNKIIILVDDGIATGATMRAAITAIKVSHPKKLIVAVPVVDKYMGNTMRSLVDEFISPMQPDGLYAVGAWYQDFAQTEDEEVHALLREAKQFAR